jgi:hypothetical protein
MHSTKRPTVAESAHMGRIKRFRCVCCTLLLRAQEHGTDVHHIDENGQARNHWLTLPLCWDCHQGHNGVHGAKRYLAILKMSQWDLLAVVISWLEAD